MPVISRSMYWNDHLPPHFHAKYGEYEITVGITSGVIEGKFPKRALKLVPEWYDMHKDELMENWELCRQQEPVKPIQPLE
ncbi:DUF4160 domain-containing protein [Desulfonema magnum]|nr:DUF4160 domain-containing protein [Desulfonema magnum]